MTAISAGSNHTCAIVNGALLCWGWNFFGEIGDGTYSNARDIPVTVVPSGVTAVALSTGRTCAIVNASLQCWGDNSDYQLGDGTNHSKMSPVTVIPSGVTAIALGAYHTCAIVSGALNCWGNRIPQLFEDFVSGDSALSNWRKPVALNFSGVTAIALGGNRTCAIVGGALKCWGFNDYGQLGDGSTTDRLSPVPILQ